VATAEAEHHGGCTGPALWRLGHGGNLTQPLLEAPPLRHYPAMVSLSDSQLSIVTDTARMVPVERRDVFLQRCGAMLKLRGRFTDADVAEVTQLAMAGLIQTADSAA
jgi:hypothetical protein